MPDALRVASSSWLERLDPLDYPQWPLTTIGKREGARFVADLTEILDAVVSCKVGRKQFENLLTAAMPPALRRAWNHRQSRRYLKQAMKYVDKRDRFKDPFLSPKQRRQDAEFRREVTRVMNAALNSPALKKPPAAPSAHNGIAPETGGSSCPPRTNSPDKSSPTLQNQRPAQPPAPSGEAKVAD